MTDKLNELKQAVITADGVAVNEQSLLTALETADPVNAAAVKAAKGEVRKAIAAAKKAATAVTREEAKVAKAAEKEAKKAADLELKAAKEQAKVDAQKAREEAKIAKDAEREAAKLAKAAEREASRMPEQNGVRRPKPETLCGQAWAIADTLSAQLGQPTPVAGLLEAARKQGLNEGNVKAEYARWRKFNGVTGRISLPKVEEPAVTDTTAV